MSHKIMSTLLAAVLAWVVGVFSPAAVAAPSAGVGHTISLSGVGDGEKIAATVVNVADPASPEFGFDRPVLGKRLVGVGLKLLNAGARPYSGSPDRGAYLADKSGRSFHAVFKSISAGAPFSGTVDIGPGETRFGYVAFEVPKSFAIDTFQFRLASGSDVKAGKWSIADAAEAAHGDPADLVNTYFGAINNGDCSAAWDIGGKNLGQSYAQFAADFCDGVRDRVTIVSASETTVRVHLDTEQVDGSHRAYAGTFLVQHGEITGAQLQRAA